MSDIKKTYVAPSVEMLGSVAEKTESGTLPNSDGRGRDTAEPWIS